jgi:hypothetical protein
MPARKQSRRIVSALAVALVWFLGARNLQAQATQAPCPGEPARFHPCALARAKTFNPPRTPDGKPDLQGYWRGLPSGTENIEEHPTTDDDDGGKSLIVEPADGKVPYQTWAVALPGQHRAQYVEPNVPCFPSGVPRSLYVPTQIEFLQTPGYVLASPHVSHHSDRRAPAHRSGHSALAGRLAWALGRQYARRRRHESQRQALVRSGGKLLFERGAHGRALHPDRSGHHPLRSDDR